jgi:hypothetical protein
VETPSRQDIRARLRQAARQVDRAAVRATGRFAPIGEGLDTPPDHEAHIKGDYSLCCASHEEHGFRAVRAWDV